MRENWKFQQFMIYEYVNIKSKEYNMKKYCKFSTTLLNILVTEVIYYRTVSML